MKKIILIAAVALLAAACEKTSETATNAVAKSVFNAWVKQHDPEGKWKAFGDSWIISYTEGTGAEIGTTDKTPYLRATYTSYDLDGNITATTERQKDLQLYGSKLDPRAYHGPVVWARKDSTLIAGLEQIVSTVRVGAKAKVAIPGWLITATSYETLADFFANVTGNDAAVYDFAITDAITDIVQWEIDSIGRYLARKEPGKSPSDSSKYGFYYIQRKAPKDTTTFPNDTVIYINYTARRLDGTVFDTTIKDTARFYYGKSFDETAEFEPVKITMAETYSDIKMGSSSTSVIDGFAYGLKKMHAFEEASFIFYSALGYSSSGTGDAVPGYCPLRFDVEVVKAP